APSTSRWRAAHSRADSSRADDRGSHDRYLLSVTVLTTAARSIAWPLAGPDARERVICAGPRLAGGAGRSAVSLRRDAAGEQEGAGMAERPNILFFHVD